MGLLGWIILGLVVGPVAKSLHERDEPGGLFGTLAVGTVGAMLGGLIASAIRSGSISSFFNAGTWVIAIGSAFLLLALYDALLGHGARRGDRVAA